MKFSLSYFFRQYPQGFNAIFIAQIAYNFSFYGLKSIYVLFMIYHLKIPDSDAISMFAILMALSYATSLFGGFMSDKGLNSFYLLITGGLFSIIGIIILFLSISYAIYLAMAALSLGAGCFKPNFSTILSSIFKDPKDPLKDQAFTKLYIAMNIGSFSGPLFCGLAYQQVGWHQAFLLIFLGFCTGIYYISRNSIQFIPSKPQLPHFNQSIVLLLFIVFYVILFVLFQHHNSIHGFIGGAVIVSLLWFGYIYNQCNKDERKDLLSTIPYILLFSFFCSLFEQSGSSLVLFFEHHVDRTLFNIEIPASTLLSLNPIFVLILGAFMPIINKLFLGLNDIQAGLAKFGIGFIAVGLSFMVFVIGSILNPYLLPIGWLIIAMLIQTLGELCIVPIGFSSISRLSPQRYLGGMMSLWLMSIAYGHYLAGAMARLSIHDTLSLNITNGFEHLFTKLGAISIIIGGVLVIRGAYKMFYNPNNI
ncbi:MAG: hypothetical protein H0U27_06560 [Nitrosopumilus sp.]|nr:hypothetical protein [Nitrosopumilus sp.]